MVEHMSYTGSLCKTAVQEPFFFPLKGPPDLQTPPPLPPAQAKSSPRPLPPSSLFPALHLCTCTSLCVPQVLDMCSFENQEAIKDMLFLIDCEVLAASTGPDCMACPEPGTPSSPAVPGRAPLSFALPVVLPRVWLNKAASSEDPTLFK